MRPVALALLCLAALPVVATAQASKQQPAQTPGQQPTQQPERLGTVSFPVSCAPASQASFNRGIALLDDFWYEEATDQFKRLINNDPSCAMAHWGLAMSGFHQIWDRPDADTRQAARAELEKAQSLARPDGAATGRERAYIAALADFYRPAPSPSSPWAYPERIAAYSQSMGALYQKYPDDVNAGAFYALALLADEKPNDTSLGQNRKAMAVLTPLFASHPDDPAVDHYIIHACDNPAMAADGLAAADHYLEIAQSGPHAYHMPGHIYARLGMWPQDIASQLGSIAASQAAVKQGESGLMDEPHSYDFLLYAYLQSGQDKRAHAALLQMPALMKNLAGMPGRMADMAPYYDTKYDVFYDLEMRDWTAAAALKPLPGSSPIVETLVYWARAIADGHLRRPVQARADLARYDQLIAQIAKGDQAYMVDSTGEKITHSEIQGWASFAEGKQDEALASMRRAADLQDKVGQGEVDIPAREMLADMLLDSGHAREALVEYKASLKLSPNRLNGLYHAGLAAEKAGDDTQAKAYFAALLKSTGGGADSSRPEFAEARSYLATPQVAAK